MEAPEAISSIVALPEHASAAACFGVSATAGDRVAIPVAEVMYGFGVGWGGEKSEKRHRESGGGGAGGGARSRGVAVIEVAPDGVTVHAVYDETAVSLARLTFAAAAVAIVATTLRRLIRP